MQRIALLTVSLLLTAFISSAQTNISGKINLKNGLPAANVNLELKELKLFSISDSAGEFLFSNINNGSYHILASSAGLQSQNIRVKVLNNEIFMEKLVLAEQVNDLEVVILTSNRGLNKQALTVGKLPINPMDLPQSMTVLGQTVIRDQQTQRLSDIIKNVNGVYLAGTRASTQETFYARGYNFSSNNMFKNGSRVNSGTLPEVSSLEKVEILKGSAAILYGNVAPGGIINMVTKQPKFKQGAEISLRTGSYGLIKPSIDVYGPISHKMAFRVNGTYEKADSYRDGVQSERFYINPSLLFKFSKRTELLVQGDYLDTEFTPDFGIGSLADTAIPKVPRSQFVGTAWQYNKAKQSTATAVLKHKINEHWSINTTAAYQLFDRDYYGVERIQAKANGDWTRPLGRILTREDYLIGNIDLIGKLKTGKIAHTLLAGVDADRYQTQAFTFDVTGKTYDTINIINLNKFIARTNIPAATKLTKTQTPVNRFGAYIQDLIHLSEKFKLLAGVRWSMQNAEAVSTNYIAKDSVGKGAKLNTDAFSPKLGLVYKPSKNLSAFASYSNSFTVNSGTDVFGNALPASLIDQFELGVKNELFDGKLSANLTLYRIVNNNLAQTAMFAADGVTINNNTALKELAGQTTSDGVEIDIASNPLRGLNILAGYSYNNMRYTKTRQAKGNYIEGERLVNTPAHTANTSIFYTFQHGSLKGLKIGAGGFYVGERFGGWNNTQQQAQAFSRLIAVDGFTTVDLSAGYTFKKVSLMAKVSNLFNKYNYYVHENYSVNPIAPRQFISTIAIKL
jgi:iron complex outermembrane receptor protein